MKIKLKSSFVIHFSCLIGCIAQLYVTTLEYVQFPVRSDAIFENPTTIELPAIDIRIPIAEIINSTQLCYRYPNQMLQLLNAVALYIGKENVTYTSPKDCPKLEESILITEVGNLYRTFYTIGDIEDLVNDTKSFIDGIYGPDEKELLESNLCDITEYFNAFAIYIRISCRNGDEPFSAPINSFASEDGTYCGLRVHSKLSFGIRFSDHNKLPDIDEANYLPINTKLSKHRLRYSKVISNSLEAPYETMCRHYDRPKFIADCITNYTSKANSSYLSNHVLSKWGEYPRHYNYSNSDDDELLPEVTRNCITTIVSPECQRVSYKTIRLDDLPNENILEEKFSLIYIQSPTDPILIIRAHPLLPISDYLIFIGSILGVWFGFSICDRLLAGLRFGYNRFVTSVNGKIPIKTPSRRRKIADRMEYTKRILNFAKCTNRW